MKSISNDTTGSNWAYSQNVKTTLFHTVVALYWVYLFWRISNVGHIGIDFEMKSFFTLFRFILADLNRNLYS